MARTNTTTGGGGGAVTQIVGGLGIGVSPIGGTGIVTITNTGGSPGAPLNSLQFNNPLGTFDGSADLLWNDTTKVLSNTGTLVMGTGATNWTLLNTRGTANQVLTTNGSGATSWASPTAFPLFADNETPGGVPNGILTAFTLAFAPSPAGSLILSRNGAIQASGGVEFTLAGLTITFVTAPLTGDLLRAWYRH